MKVYDILYITNLPSFYKINLLNEIAKHKSVIVLFTHTSSEIRNADFYYGVRHFNYFQPKSGAVIDRYILFFKVFFHIRYKQVFLVGWDQTLLWIFAFLSPKRKNRVVIESSIYESSVNGFKGFLKKIYLTRITKAFVSGSPQAELLRKLSFGGVIIKTFGVGIFNIINQVPYIKKSAVNNFIYVGRLSSEKNLELLINTFNELRFLTLTIVGYGPLREYLESIAESNTKFLGAIPNHGLPSVFRKYDVLILPSFSEPWGLVVEEALNNGLPVIVSDKVGCSVDIVNTKYGIVFSLKEPDGLKKAIFKMIDINYYNNLRMKVSHIDFHGRMDYQIGCYLKN